VPGLGVLLRKRALAPEVFDAHVRLQALSPDQAREAGVAKGSNELRLQLGGKEYSLLTGVSPTLEATPVPGGGAFLALHAARNRSLHDVPLGLLQCRRFLAAARTKRWWMGPMRGKSGGEMPVETQFVLLELASDAYAVILPLVDGAMRTSLRGEGVDSLVAQVQSGCPEVKAQTVQSALYVGVGASPYELLRQAFDASARRLRTFDVVSRKEEPADLDKFGWCTWDAFYQSVSPAGITQGISSLHDGGTPPRVLLIDDGWQTVRHDDGSGIVEDIVADAELAAAKNEPSHQSDAHSLAAKAVGDWYRNNIQGAPADAAAVQIWRFLTRTVLRRSMADFFDKSTEFSKRLSSFKANRKFEDRADGTTLRNHIEALRSKFGSLKVYCWHTLGGYWGGVSTESDEMKGLRARQVQQHPTQSLLEVEPELSWDAASMCGTGMVGSDRESTRRLFDGIHAYLARSGVDGVKVDAQSGIGPFGYGHGGGPVVVGRHVQEMEASVARHFSGNRCVNCMCHSTENLYQYKTTSLIRAADDFYPRDDASQPVHLANVAYNSLFLGEIGHVDWDMFQSTHPDAAMHAAARAVGGSPVYVSDRPDKHDFELLKKLVLPDGSILRCKSHGRPTRDILFADVNSDGVSALKLWNMNAVTGLLGAFNIQGARWDRKRRAFVECDEPDSVSCTIKPSDVEDFIHGEDEEVYATFSHRGQQLKVLQRRESHAFQLRKREWDLFTISAIKSLRGVSWAPLGLTAMLNGGGAVVKSNLSSRLRHVLATVTLRAKGKFTAYCNPRPTCVEIDGQRAEFTHDAATGLLAVGMKRSAESAEVAVWFSRRAALSSDK